MQIDTKVSRGNCGATMNGWQGATLIELPGVLMRSASRQFSKSPPPAFLKISTLKHSTRIIRTSAYVFFMGTEGPIHTEGNRGPNGDYSIGGDYFRHLREGHGVGTKKKISSFHDASLEALPEILDQVAKHYGLNTADDLFRQLELA